MRLVPFVPSEFGAMSWVFVPGFGRCLSYGISSAPFARCSSLYQVGVFLVSGVDVPCVPHSAFHSDIVCIIFRNVITSFCIALRSQGRYLSSVASLDLHPFELVVVFRTIQYSAFRTRIRIWAASVVKQRN